MQQQIDDAERDEIFLRLKADPENNKCFDCEKKNTKWTSVNLGLYLCLDCAGKHRSYGPHITFVRSVNLDVWNKRYITFMEFGGNSKALEYFRKHGLKAPYDYKNPLIQKYKAELTKKVDNTLEASSAKLEESKPIYASKAEPKAVEEDDITDNKVAFKSFSDKPAHGEKASEDPFANNIVINKAETKTKGFTVEFSKKNTGTTANKGRIAAKKIDNVDLDMLTLNEDGSQSQQVVKEKSEMMESAFGGSSQNNVKEVYTKSSSPYTSDQSTEDKLKKYQNAKAISSDSFKSENKGFEASNINKFSGATAISSSQYFGEKEDTKGGIDYYQTAENVKDFLSGVSGKLKDRADGLVTKLKEKWQQQS